MKMSYVEFLIKSADCPSIDYDSKKDKKTSEEINTADTADSQIATMAAALR